MPLVGHTKTRILFELRGSGRRTANEIASSLKIQVSAVRKHLDALYAAGIVAQEFVKDGIGRPKKFYSLSEIGREMFPRQYELVLNSLIEKLIASTDRSFAENLMKRVATDILRLKQLEFQNGEKESTLGERLDRLKLSAAKFGFDTAIETLDSGSIRLISHNCPLYKSAKKYPDLMCKGFHGEIIRNALGTDNVKLEHCVLSGDSTCVHFINLAAKSPSEARSSLG